VLSELDYGKEGRAVDEKAEIVLHIYFIVHRVSPSYLDCQV